MNIPDFLYGRYSQVRRRCLRVLSELRGGARLEALTGQYLDTRSTTGLLIIDGPLEVFAREDHFHLFALVREIFLMKDDLNGAFFEDSLANGWSLLGLLGQAAQPWLFEESRQRAFLAAVRRHWGELDAAGPRYTRVSTEGKSLWRLPATTIHQVLIWQGLDQALVSHPLPPGGIAELIDMLPPRRR